MNENVIVSGANGFIGSAVIRALSPHWRKIYAVVKDENENITSLLGIDNVEIVYCELDDFDSLPDKIQNTATAFYHFAWVGVSGEDHRRVDAQLKNISYTVSAVNAAHALGCKKFIFASSVTEYECAQLMTKQKSPSPACYYSACKTCAANIAKTLCAEHTMDYFQAIITNIYGIGDYSNRFLNANLKRIIKNEPTEFTAGEQTYDFIYISDAAEILRLLPEKGIRNKPYYIGSGKPRPVKEFLMEMGEVVKPSIPLGLGKIPFSGESLDYSATFNINAVKDDLGYVPQTDFKQGIYKTYEWLKSIT